MTRMLFALLGACLMGLTGCFHIKEEITLNADMSGTATIGMGINMEPMAYVMAMFTKSMSGDESPPTEDEVGAARAELLAQQSGGNDPFDSTDMEKIIGSTMTEGVRVYDATFAQDGLKMNFAVAVEFDHVDRLTGLEFPNPDGGSGAVQGENPMDKPFEGLMFVDDGDTMLLTNQPVNPAQEQMANGEVPPEMEGLFREMMSDLRVDFIVTSALPVVEHNATRVDGDTYYWEYDAEDLMGSPTAGEQILLRLEK